MHAEDSDRQCGLRVNWAELNNALFALIYSDPDLFARYDRADYAEACNICSDVFDLLAGDAADFLERFIVVER